MEGLRGVGLFLILSWAMSATIGPILHLLQNLRCGSARLSHPEVKWLLVVMTMGPMTWITGGDRTGVGGVGVGDVRLGVSVSKGGSYLQVWAPQWGNSPNLSRLLFGLLKEVTFGPLRQGIAILWHWGQESRRIYSRNQP